MKAWHFVKKDRRLRYDDNRTVKAGRTYTAKGKLEMCRNGMHASEDILDALKYAPGPVVCLVDLSGEILKDTNKICARHRKVLGTKNIEKILHEFTCRCAERALREARVTDKRSWGAIKAKRLWVAGEINDDKLSTPWDAAWAWATATAGDAAGDAERRWQRKELAKMIGPIQ